MCVLFSEKIKPSDTTQKTDLGMRPNSHFQKKSLRVIINLPSTIKTIPSFWLCCKPGLKAVNSRKQNVGGEIEAALLIAPCRQRSLHSSCAFATARHNRHNQFTWIRCMIQTADLEIGDNFYVWQGGVLGFCCSMDLIENGGFGGSPARSPVCSSPAGDLFFHRQTTLKKQNMIFYYFSMIVFIKIDLICY